MTDAMRLPWTARTRTADLRRGDAGRAHLPARRDAGHPSPPRAVGRGRHRDGHRDHARTGDAYLVAFRLPEEIDPDQRQLLRRGRPGGVREGRRRARRSGCGCWRTGPSAHRVEGEIDSKAPYVIVAVADALVLAWVCGGSGRGRRRPSRADARPQPTSSRPTPTTRPARLARDGDVYEAVGTVRRPRTARSCSTSGSASVVVALAGYDYPVAVGSPARARGPLVG